MSEIGVVYMYVGVRSKPVGCFNNPFNELSNTGNVRVNGSDDDMLLPTERAPSRTDKRPKRMLGVMARSKWYSGAMPSNRLASMTMKMMPTPSPIYDTWIWMGEQWALHDEPMHE